MPFIALLSAIAVLVTGAGVLAAPASGAPASGGSGASTGGSVYLVQGLVGRSPDLYVDGERVGARVAAKSVVGPLRLAPGGHDVEVREGDRRLVAERVAVRAGQVLDVVTHVEADAAGVALTPFADDVSPVTRGSLRLAVAHVAAAPPADILVDGDVLFSNVANGEALTVEVPGGRYRVEVRPSVTPGPAILGPVQLSVTAGTLTRVFAVGDVTRGSMDAVVHSIPVRQTGSAVPGSVQTGTGGQAATSFVPTGARPAARGLAPLGYSPVYRPGPWGVPGGWGSGWNLAGGTLAARPALAPSAAPEGPGAPGGRVPVQAGGTRFAGFVPVSMQLPTGEVAPIRPATVGVDGSLAVPDDPDVLGRWDGGARAGERFGTTVLAGHVDAAGYGIGVLADLRTARPGQLLQLRGGEGRQLSYRVVGVRQVPKARLATDTAAFDRRGPHRLVLITCGGAFDRASGHYLDNVVIEAVPVA